MGATSATTPAERLIMNRAQVAGRDSKTAARRCGIRWKRRHGDLTAQPGAAGMGVPLPDGGVHGHVTCQLPAEAGTSDWASAASCAPAPINQQSP